MAFRKAWGLRSFWNFPEVSSSLFPQSPPCPIPFLDKGSSGPSKVRVLSASISHPKVYLFEMTDTITPLSITILVYLIIYMPMYLFIYFVTFYWLFIYLFIYLFVHSLTWNIIHPLSPSNHLKLEHTNFSSCSWASYVLDMSWAWYTEIIYAHILPIFFATHHRCEISGLYKPLWITFFLSFPLLSLTLSSHYTLSLKLRNL